VYFFFLTEYDSPWCSREIRGTFIETEVKNNKKSERSFSEQTLKASFLEGSSWGSNSGDPEPVSQWERSIGSSGARRVAFSFRHRGMKPNRIYFYGTLKPLGNKRVTVPSAMSEIKLKESHVEGVKVLSDIILSLKKIMFATNISILTLARCVKNDF